MQERAKGKLEHKEELVPKEGKGKYNITVPVAFEFLNRQRERKTIREQKLEEMLKESRDREEHEKSVRFTANAIPRTTKEPLYQRILESNEQRREEVRRMSIALTKQNERPFSFYKRDQQRGQQQKQSVPQTMLHPPFKASIIPWKVRVPLYREMVEREEYARELRVKRQAEISLSLAKLPPRMQEYEDSKKQQSEIRSQSVDLLFSFQPPKPKPVPDFKRLQKNF